MDRPYEKVGIVFLDHFRFELLSKFGFPSGAAVLPSPRPVCLPHLPVSAEHRVTPAIGVTAPKLVAEIEWNLFQRKRCLQATCLRDRAAG